MTQQQSGSLREIRVLDLTQAMPGAIVTMMLADYGADVIRVERPPSPTPLSLAGVRTWARGHRLMTLQPSRLSELHALADEADLVITDLTPQEAAGLGVDEPSLRARNRDVVHLALTGFGLDDARDTPPIDVLVAAELGAMRTVVGANRDGPVFLGHPAIAYSTALTALIGVLAAIRGRLVTGRGESIDVSLFDGLLAQFTMNWWTERNISFLSDRRPDGQLDLGRARMLVRRYTCADGRMIQIHTGAAGAFGRLMKLVGLDHRVSSATGPIESACPLTDGDLAVLEELPSIFETKTSDEWLADMWDNEIAALPILAPTEVFDDEQVRHNGLVRMIEDPELGPIEVVAPPIHLGLTPACTGPPDRPDAAATWSAQGLPASEAGPGSGRDELVDGPLTGIRIVELATFFAGPYANRFLRDLGADVVKVEPLSGDPMRSLPDPFEGVARGKRSVAIDMKAPQTRAVIEALLRRADVVQHNFRPGVAERLGVDSHSVQAINPGVIYDYAPGYGSSGPKSRLQSFAPLHSGFVGVQVEAAGEGNPPTITFGNEDYFNGQLNAIGVLLALIERERSGRGQTVECAQLNSSVFVTSHWYRRAGQPHSMLPDVDHEQFGWSPFRRLYQCLEGFVCVCCVTPQHEQALRNAVLGTDATGGEQDQHQENERLTYEFFGRTASDWVNALAAVGVPCVVAAEGAWLHEYLTDPNVVESGRATMFEHRQAGRVSVIGQIVKLVGWPPREPVQAPQLGEHTLEVIGELGLEPELGESLVRLGLAVVASNP